MTCCPSTIIPFNSLTTNIAITAPVIAKHGLWPNIQVKYRLADGTLFIADVASQVKVEVISGVRTITIDHGGLGSGIITLL